MLPGEKVEERESEIDGAIRELFEEIGIKTGELEFLVEHKWYFSNEGIVYPTFRLRLFDFVEVKVDPNEHSKYMWVTPRKCYAMRNLVQGFHDLLRQVYFI